MHGRVAFGLPDEYAATMADALSGTDIDVTVVAHCEVDSSQRAFAKVTGLLRALIDIDAAITRRAVEHLGRGCRGDSSGNVIVLTRTRSAGE